MDLKTIFKTIFFFGIGLQDLLGRIGDMGDDARASADCGVTGTVFKLPLCFLHNFAHFRIVLSIENGCGFPIYYSVATKSST